MIELTYEQKQARQALYTSTFMWMFVGVAITGVISYFLAASGILLKLIYTMGQGYLIFSVGMMIAQIAVVVNFTRNIMKSSVASLKRQFLFYSALLGVSTAAIFFIYDLGVIATAFFFAAALFGSLVFTGFVLKMDLTKYRSYFVGALIALIVINIVSIFVVIPQADLYIGLLGLVIFMALTIYDVQRMNKVYNAIQQDEETAVAYGERYSVYFALQLYLDFMNLFLYILRILGRRK